MIKLKDLQTAAKELNEVLGLDPEINPKLKEVELTAQVKKAIELTTEDDEFSKTTQAVIKELTAPVKKEKKGKVIATKVEEVEDIEDEIEEEEDEEEDELDATEFVGDEEEEEEISKDDTLREEIETAPNIKFLKELAVTNGDLFPNVMKTIKKAKNIDELRYAMLAELDSANTTEEIVEEAEEEIVEEVKPAKKEKAPKQTEEVVEEAPAKKGKKGDKKEVVVENVEKSAVKKEKKESNFPKVSTSEKVEFITPFIAAGKYTRKQLHEMLMKKFPDSKELGIVTMLTDCKNPKYNRFAKLVEVDADGIYKFVGGAKGKK